MYSARVLIDLVRWVQDMCMSRDYTLNETPVQYITGHYTNIDTLIHTYGQFNWPVYLLVTSEQDRTSGHGFYIRKT